MVKDDSTKTWANPLISTLKTGAKSDDANRNEVRMILMKSLEAAMMIPNATFLVRKFLWQCQKGEYHSRSRANNKREKKEDDLSKRQQHQSSP
jgi:hypothetical protein